MLKHENTPCPLPTGASGSGMDGHARRFSSVSETTMTGACENDTTDVVASIMGREFENARAQRRQTLLQKPRKKARVSIFEDGTASTIGPEMGAQRERQEAGVGVARSDLNRRQSFFARPARKGRLETLKEGLPVLGYDGVQEREQILYEEEETGGGRRDDSFFAPAQDQPAERKDGLKKNPRRRTIWVPNDDTTIMTIHPGAHTETLADPTLFASKTAAGLDMDTAGLVQGKDSSEDVTTKRMPRKSLAVAPKRVALGSLAKQQPNARLGDVVGQNGGKENLPPGGRDHGKKTITEKPAITHTFLKKSTTKPAVPTEKPSSKTPPQDIVAKPELRISRLLQPTAASQARLNESKKRNMSESREGAVRARIQPKQSVSVARSQMSRSASAIAGASSRVGSLALSRSTTTTAPVSATLSNSRTVGRVPTKLSIPAAVSTRKAQLELYPVLPNDLSRPELYEENWLSHQEVALTQLLNGLFEKAEDTDDASFPQISLRDKLLQLYQQPTFTTLHKRLQASLLYGALSLPKDAQPPNLKEDVGLRRRFLDLWLETYELDVLQSAAEVIIGRLIPEKFSRSSNSSASRSSSTTQTTSKRSLEKFLLTFLIAHDDALAADASTSTSTHPPAWHWQRTVLRSLLLLALLDHAALTHTLPTRLFRPNSPHKSSPAVLHALSTLLIPSIGDIARPLGYLDYRVTHTQYALQEHSYRVTNLAVDLRDGVLLTRLVELLLYAPTALCAREDAAADATLTLILPGGTTLTSTLNPGLSAGTDLSTGVWPLSQHLIFPAPSRAQKVYNTSIALAALRGLGGLAAAATANVRAEDVVDGHREKTLCLLWALISRWGVGLLVDWRALRWEVGRLGREGGEDVDDEDDTDNSDAEDMGGAHLRGPRRRGRESDVEFRRRPRAGCYRRRLFRLPSLTLDLHSSHDDLLHTRKESLRLSSSPPNSPRLHPLLHRPPHDAPPTLLIHHPLPPHLPGLAPPPARAHAPRRLRAAARLSLASRTPRFAAARAGDAGRGPVCASGEGAGSGCGRCGGGAEALEGSVGEEGGGVGKGCGAVSEGGEGLGG
ncbi:hypothetical protein M8818_000108 [Zalaria obscura]|uniref:Uncharacterized protein n=1 Tax=Zalaria obscura TaxID=2024903 RepID=A0ACC3SP32_9PEZI